MTPWRACADRGGRVQSRGAVRPPAPRRAAPAVPKHRRTASGRSPLRAPAHPPSDHPEPARSRRGIDAGRAERCAARRFHQAQVLELQQARAATARYRHIKNAFKDGYVDINVVVPNMGYHFMKSELTADGVFDVRKPEILVYNKNEDGSFELGALEYAVPIDVTPDVAPEGFTGTDDVWERNTDFGLWLVHAWVWKNNPDGTFNPTNPLVIVH